MLSVNAFNVSRDIHDKRSELEVTSNWTEQLEEETYMEADTYNNFEMMICLWHVLRVTKYPSMPSMEELARVTPTALYVPHN